VLSEIFATARELRQELLAKIPRSELETCMRVLGQICERAEMVTPEPFIQKATGTRNGSNGNHPSTVRSRTRTKARQK
jgi:hypothetical protein